MNGEGHERGMAPPVFTKIGFILRFSLCRKGYHRDITDVFIHFYADDVFLTCSDKRKNYVFPTLLPIHCNGQRTELDCICFYLVGAS